MKEAFERRIRESEEVADRVVDIHSREELVDHLNKVSWTMK